MGNDQRPTPTVKMVRYAATEIHPTKSARARGAYLRVSFKNTRETAQAINGWKLQRAVKFLENVQEHKEAVPMRRYAGGTGRASQGKQFGGDVEVEAQARTEGGDEDDVRQRGAGGSKARQQGGQGLPRQEPEGLRLRPLRGVPYLCAQPSAPRAPSRSSAARGHATPHALPWVQGAAEQRLSKF